jgi:hypothetical protein
MALTNEKSKTKKITEMNAQKAEVIQYCEHITKVFKYINFVIALYLNKVSLCNKCNEKLNSGIIIIYFNFKF